MKKIKIRRPLPSDATTIATIDTQGIATGHATFRDVPHNWNSFNTSYLTGNGFALVAEDNKDIVAWAGVSSTSERPVYKGVGEVSIYVANHKQGCGIGRYLLEELISTSEQAGFWTLIAQIFPENTASLSLHFKVGFKLVGTRKKLGKMEYGPLSGCWRDVMMLERRSHSIVNF